MWKRYRFKTKAEDYRPLIFNPKYPWWCSGEGVDLTTHETVYAVIIAYLPEGEDLKKYWDDAYDIAFEDRNKITFTERFPKPGYFLEG